MGHGGKSPHGSRGRSRDQPCVLLSSSVCHRARTCRVCPRGTTHHYRPAGPGVLRACRTNHRLCAACLCSSPHNDCAPVPPSAARQPSLRLRPSSPPPALPLSWRSRRKRTAPSLAAWGGFLFQKKLSPSTVRFPDWKASCRSSSPPARASDAFPRILPRNWRDLSRKAPSAPDRVLLASPHA